MSVGSVANSPTENDTLAGTGTTRPNPVALETPVTVTGAQPSSEGARDLFTEETRTILVFVDGAVIQLESAVSDGQLLFLTSKKSNEEVVCQVLRKRKFGSTACYVELQFTEDKPNYWGVSFPKGKKRGAEFTAAEQVAAEQTTEQKPGTPPPARSEKDSEDLKAQVEALRKQLAELEKQNAAEAAAKAVAERAAAEEHAAAEAAIREAEEAKASAAKAKRELDTAQQSAPENRAGAAGGETLLMPPADPENKKVPGWTVKMALPTQPKSAAAGAAKDREGESLPNPELDFSRVPQTASAEEIAARASLKNVSPWREKLRIAGFVVVLGAVGFGAYEKLAPYLTDLIKKPAATASAGKRAPAKPAAAAQPSPVGAAAPVPAGSAAASSATTAGAAPASTNAAVEPAGKQPGNKDGNATPAGVSEAKGSDPAPPAVADEDTAKKASGAKERASKKARSTGVAAETAPSEVAVPADAPVTAAKLLHAAPPVYPPEAMRHYITGDVKAELVVEASGRVGDVKVITGPSALRDAAVDALRKYEYAPATQGGKAVASKTTAVVKFWFNP